MFPELIEDHLQDPLILHWKYSIESNTKSNKSHLKNPSNSFHGILLKILTRVTVKFFDQSFELMLVFVDVILHCHHYQHIDQSMKIVFFLYDHSLQIIFFFLNDSKPQRTSYIKETGICLR